jgi:hypothetical protein
MEDALDTCPECSGHQFSVKGENLNIHAEDNKLMAASQDEETFTMTITCEGCGTGLKPTRKGLRKI